MFNNILLEIINLRWFIITYVVAVLLVYIFFWFRTRSFDWNKGNVRWFGVLYGLPAVCRVLLGLSLGRFFIIMVSAFLCKSTGIYQLAVLLVLTIIINCILVDYKGIFAELISYLGIFGILFLQRVIYMYYLQVEQNWTLMVMVVLMGIFAVLYATFGMVRMMDKIMKKDMEKNERQY